MVSTRAHKKRVEFQENSRSNFSILKKKYGIKKCCVSLEKLTPQQIQQFTRNVPIVEVKAIGVSNLLAERRSQPKRAAKEPKIAKIFEKVEEKIYQNPRPLVKYTKNINQKIILPIEIGQHVLAKQKYSVPWPARVLAIRKTSADVHFYGDGRKGPVQRTEISMISKQVICDNIHKNIANYRKAVRELEVITKEILANS